jgi:ubiquinone/menaquinone biosynthesis C-methylase UbiE
MSAFYILTPYTPLFSAFYDYFITPAVFDGLWVELQKNFLKVVAPNSHLLDVGCRSGQYAIEIVQKRPDLQVTGLDSSPEQVKQAQKRARQLGLEEQVRFLEGTALELPFKKEDFDHIYSIGSIKHWADRKKGLSECLRVLKSGGNIFVIEADQGSYYQDVVNWVNKIQVSLPLKPILEMYYHTYVAGQSIALEDAQDLWSALPLVNKNGPRKILGIPGLVMSATKQHSSSHLSEIQCGKIDNVIENSFWDGKLLD